MAIVKQSVRLGWGLLAGMLLGCGVPSQAGTPQALAPATTPEAAPFAVQQLGTGNRNLRRSCTTLCKRARAASVPRCVRLCVRQFRNCAGSAVPGAPSLVGPGEPGDDGNGSADDAPETGTESGQDASGAGAGEGGT